MVTLIVDRTPQFEEELRRDFRPTSITEADIYREVAHEGRLYRGWRRQRVITYVAADQNSERQVIHDLGPATGEDSFVIDDGVEMAHAIELIEMARRNSEARKARSLEVEPLRTAAWLKAIDDINEENKRKATAVTTVGPHARVQRS